MDDFNYGFQPPQDQTVNFSAYNNYNSAKKRRRKIRIILMFALALICFVFNAKGLTGAFSGLNSNEISEIGITEEQTTTQREIETTTEKSTESFFNYYEESTTQEYDEEYSTQPSYYTTSTTTKVQQEEVKPKTIYDEGDCSLWYNYCQLSVPERRCYYAMYKKLIDGETYFTVMCPPTNAASALMNKIYLAVLNDHPEIFWAYRCRYTYSAQDTSYDTFECKITIQNYDFWEWSMSKKRLMSKLNDEVEEIAALALQEGGTFDQIKFVHDYFVENITYDNEALKYTTNESVQDGFCFARSAYGALVKKSVVCAGYAKGFQLVMNRLGYNCAYIVGDAGGGHAWNLIQLGGKYYWMDLTWDDPDKPEVNDMVFYNYFCVPDSIMLKKHTPNSVPRVPSCTATEYDYYRVFGLYINNYSMNSFRSVLLRQSEQQIVTVKFRDENQLNQAMKDVSEAVRGIWSSDRHFVYYHNSEACTMTIVFN